MHVLILMLDSPREGILFPKETITAQPIIPAASHHSCLSSLTQTSRNPTRAASLTGEDFESDVFTGERNLASLPAQPLVSVTHSRDY